MVCSVVEYSTTGIIVKATNNTGNAEIEGDQIKVFKILNGHENIDSNIFFKIKTGEITRGHELSADCVHSSSVNMFN